MGDTYSADNPPVLSYGKSIVHDDKTVAAGSSQGTAVIKSHFTGSKSLHNGTGPGIHIGIDLKQILAYAVFFRQCGKVRRKLMDIYYVSVIVSDKDTVHKVFHVRYYIKIIFEHDIPSVFFSL